MTGSKILFDDQRVSMALVDTSHLQGGDMRTLWFWVLVSVGASLAFGIYATVLATRTP